MVRITRKSMPRWLWDRSISGTYIGPCQYKHEIFVKMTMRSWYTNVSMKRKSLSRISDTHYVWIYLENWLYHVRPSPMPNSSMGQAGVSNLSHCRTFVRQTGQNVRQAIFKYDPFVWQFEEKITEVSQNFPCRETKTVLSSPNGPLLINTQAYQNTVLCLRDNYLS